MAGLTRPPARLARMTSSFLPNMGSIWKHLMGWVGLMGRMSGWSLARPIGWARLPKDMAGRDPVKPQERGTG